MENQKVIPVFFSSDDNYAPFLSVAIESIKKNSSDKYLYNIIVLSEELSNSSKELLLRQEKENLKINFVNLSDKIKEHKVELEKTLRDYYTVSIFYRMFIANAFPEYDKAVYIDADIVLLDDIAKLYEVDLGDNLVGAVSDRVVLSSDIFIRYTEEVVGTKKGDYFNSGVLVMNLKGFRNQQIEEKFIKTLKKYNFLTVAPDQDYLNFFCLGKVKYLSDDWNFMPSVSGEVHSGIKLIHYNMFAKPWLYKGITLEEHFWHYAYFTELYSKLKIKRQLYDSVKMENDIKSNEKLLKTAKEITDSKQKFISA